MHVYMGCGADNDTIAVYELVPKDGCIQVPLRLWETRA